VKQAITEYSFFPVEHTFSYTQLLTLVCLFVRNLLLKQALRILYAVSFFFLSFIYNLSFSHRRHVYDC
jgi:hypothetical protein